jgi:hypothetical protein
MPPLAGDQLLARAVTAPHLSSYSVPVNMSVRVRKPIGIHSGLRQRRTFARPRKPRS